MKDVKTLALVIRRTNYGEADRILNLITPEGKMSVLAKGVRKEKSKLAGSVEMFTLSEITAHQGKSELLILTGASMKEFYQGILADLDKIELASKILKLAGKAPEEAGEMFNVAQQALKLLDMGHDAVVIEAWFLLNYLRVSGEQINLITDVNGEKLEAESHYVWDHVEQALKQNEAGKITASEIKMMRLMWGGELAMALRVKGVNVKEILEIVSRRNDVI